MHKEVYTQLLIYLYSINTDEEHFEQAIDFVEEQNEYF